MLMRRARREVYRVYDADEYLAKLGFDEPVEAVTRRSVDRRPHQIVGAMMLVVVIGALGALLAIVGLSSIGTGRRARSKAPMAADSTTAADAARVHDRQEDAMSRQAPIRSLRRLSSGLKPRRTDTDRQVRKFVAASSQHGARGIPVRADEIASAPSSAVEVADVLTRPVARHRQPDEFGFER